jgi:hypothetical protein
MSEVHNIILQERYIDFRISKGSAISAVRNIEKSQETKFCAIDKNTEIRTAYHQIKSLQRYSYSNLHGPSWQ